MGIVHIPNAFTELIQKLGGVQQGRRGGFYG